jgi:predicted permease
MRILREWLTRLLATIRPRRTDDDLEAELRSHLELATDDAVRRGTSPGEARRTASVHGGAMGSALEAVRDQRGLPWMDDFTRDLRHAVRALRRSPAFTLTALLTFALGTGAVTAVFTVVNRVLIQPLRYPDSEALVAVWHTAPGAPGLASVSRDLRMSVSMYFSYAQHARTFQSIGLWAPFSASVTGDGQPEQVRVVLVTDGTLQALAVPPAHGRWLSASDQIPGSAPFVMLGHGFWQRRYGGNPHVVGQTILVDSRPREIAGIMPSGFRIVTAEPDLIVPLAPDRATARLPGFGFAAVARLKPGATLQEATSDITRMIPIWMRSWPAAPGIDPRIYEAWRIAPALRPLKDDVVGGVRTMLWVVMGTVAGVMLIASANVANLLLVRAEGRRHELGVRAALGAGRWRIARALVVESSVLALAGGAVGVVLAGGGLRLLAAVGPAMLPRLDEVALDVTAIAFAIGVSSLAGILFGLMSMPWAGRLQIGAGERAATASPARQRARQGLVLVQVALAMVLLVFSGLMIRTFVAMTRVDAGIARPSYALTARTSIPFLLEKDPLRVAHTHHAIVEKLSSIPGVRAAGFTTALPLEGITPDWDAVAAEGREYARNEIPPFRLFKAISPGYLAAAGTRLVAGRDYEWTDLYGGRRHVLVSENLAREFWGSPEAALGRRLRTLVDTAPWREVIGVVQDVYENGVHEPAPATVYWPTFGESAYRAGNVDVERNVTFVIRGGQSGAEALAPSMHDAVWAVNPNLPLASVRTLQEVYDRSMERTSFALVMLGIAAAVSVLLGVIGVYGVLSYTVAQRRREIGIRLALGAQQREVIGMFVRHGLAMAGIGIVAGLVAAAAATRTMAAILFGVGPLDPVTYASVPAILAAATLVATLIPARRAAVVDPAQALRSE